MIYLHTHCDIIKFRASRSFIARSAPFVPFLGGTSIIGIEELPMDIFQQLQRSV